MDNTTTPTPLTDAQLAEWAEVAEKATPGPWIQTRNIASGVKIWPSEHGSHPILSVLGGVAYSRITDDDPVPQWQKNADFVRLARTALPALLAELRRVRAVEQAARDFIDNRLTGSYESEGQAFDALHALLPTEVPHV